MTSEHAVTQLVSSHVQKVSSYNAVAHVDFCSVQSVAQFSVNINLLQPALTNKLGPWPCMTQPAVTAKCTSTQEHFCLSIKSCYVSCRKSSSQEILQFPEKHIVIDDEGRKLFMGKFKVVVEVYVQIVNKSRTNF